MQNLLMRPLDMASMKSQFMYSEPVFSRAQFCLLLRCRNQKDQQATYFMLLAIIRESRVFGQPLLDLEGICRK